MMAKARDDDDDDQDRRRDRRIRERLRALRARLDDDTINDRGILLDLVGLLVEHFGVRPGHEPAA